MPIEPSQYADTRELATILWVVILAAAAAIFRPPRVAVLKLMRQLTNWKLWLPMTVYAVHIVGLVYAAYCLDMWTWSLFAATLIWFFASGLALLAGGIANATKTRSYFRQRLKDLAVLTILLEFFINVRPLPFLGELVLIPVMAFLAVAQGVLARSPESSAGARLASGASVCIVAGLLVWTVIGVVNDPDMSIGDLLRQFLLPVWLTVFALPVVFIAALLASYELLFSRLRAFNKVTPPFAVRLGLAGGLKADFYAIGRFAGQRAYQTARVSTFREARREVAQYGFDEARREAERQGARQRLIDMAGVAGTDDQGRELDRREFSPTKESLLYLHTCMMGHYRKANRYRPDMLSIIGDFQKKGLQEPHGIKLKVRQDGRAWFAYRKTPSGFCFGIGAIGAPGSQWVYAGHRHPSGFPSERGGWTDFLSNTPLEWQTEPAT